MVIEEIVGEIKDEFDIEEAPVVDGEGKIIVAGNLSLHDLEGLLERGLPHEVADTVSGLVFAKLGKIPEEGEIVQLPNMVLKVIHVENQRITEIEVQRRESIEELDNRETGDEVTEP